MKHYTKTIRAAAKKPLHTSTEHHPAHAQALRKAVRATGKKIDQLTANELIELNENVSRELEASHERTH